MRFFNIVVLEDKVGDEMRYQANIKEMPGLHVEGSSLQELFGNLPDAIGLWLASTMESDVEMDKEEITKRNIFETGDQGLEGS